ncbi:MAG: hypothetical protein DRQ88_12905 [Epsilonproteobacteria bacterium]|nr:MAG: hypothetical protein DRQ89_12955 [Campylobacterota bacterium]RLA63042.1 MAG: hypothetical protein DRQ88_12905 [Campylobacterota bacterium]
MKLNLRPSEILGFSFVFVLTLIGVIMANTNVVYFESVYVREDGLIEWLTFSALACSALLSFLRIKRLASIKNFWFVMGLLFFGLVFLFGAGEEISWGQRIFDWSVPEFFAKNNLQGETNIHNLVVGGTKINKLVFGLLLGIAIGCYFLILPPLYKKIDKIKALVDSVALPIPKNSHLVAYLILFGLSFLIPSPKKGEILEFGGTFIFFLLLLHPYNENIFSRDS